MSAHPLKQFLYHHTITARLYNIIRGYRRDKYNKLGDEEFANLLHTRHTGKGLDFDNPKTFDEGVVPKAP